MFYPLIPFGELYNEEALFQTFVKKHMLIDMSQSKDLDPLRSLTLKVKPKRNLKYLPTYLLT
jgi:hypothetical protein